MIEVSVYFVVFCGMLCSLCITGFFGDIFDYIKKGKWYVAVIWLTVCIIVYFILVRILECILI